MSEGPAIEMGQRFSADLRRIREARGVSVAQLHDETKIPLSLIEAFEQTGLFDHDMFNRVYLRSFVRTYADVIGIEAEQALQGLEKALNRSYDGELAAAYLEKPAPPEQEQTAEAERAEEAEVEADEAVEGREEDASVATAAPATAAPVAAEAAPAPDVATPAATPRQADVHHDEPLRREAQLGLAHGPEGPDEQARPHQQEDGERDLGHQKRAP